MKYKAIIFDMDGTIVDTEKIWIKANHALVNRRGIEISDQDLQELKLKLQGAGLHYSCSIIKDLFGLKEPLDELIVEKSQIAGELYHQGLDFIEGFADFHAQVAHLKSALATNADDNTIMITRQKLMLERFFGEHIYGISCVGNMAKPHPAIYEHAAAKLNIDPRDCLAVEDSPAGINAAQAAGMHCIGINTGLNREVIKHADTVVDFYHEVDLKKLLGS